MNFNANVRQPLPLGKKVKRVSDVNAMGLAAPAHQFIPSPMQSPPDPIAPEKMYPPLQNPVQFATGNPPQHAFAEQPTYSSVNPGIPPGAPQAQFAVFQQPIVQDMAIQYGQKLADQGKQLVETQFEKWVPVTRLKYYFAVDNKYVLNKIRLLFFPFSHKNWSTKYDSNNSVQPRYDLNAPDLYIPTMAYITYVVVAGLLLGLQNRFSPEQLGIQASSALAYYVFELLAYSISLYVANIPGTLKTLDLAAYAGYKFVIIVTCLLASILFFKAGYYVGLIYSCLSMTFFLLRSLNANVNATPGEASNTTNWNNYDSYGAQQNQSFNENVVGRKRKIYFLFFVAGFQVFLSFWLSNHLVPDAPKE